MPFGFGIVGCGMISNFHAQAIAGIRNAQLVGCYDMFPKAADRFAEEQDCIAYHNLDEMLANDDIRIITICTPSGAHLEPAVAAARAGKHVLVEKPLEISLKKCDRIIAACEKAGVQLGTIMPSRFSAANVALKGAIKDGRFGKLTLGDTYVKWWRSQEYYDSGGWRGTWALDGGGAYMNQAIHNVDLLYWFMGDVAEVCAITDTLAHERIEVEDTGCRRRPFRQRSDRYAGSHHQRLSGPAEKDRDPWHHRNSHRRTGRHYSLGIRPEASQGSGDPREIRPG